MTTHDILPLRDARDLGSCGNKAVNLGRAMRTGLVSQDGFVVQAKVLDDNLMRLGLCDRFTQVLAQEDGADADFVRDAIQSGGLPDALGAAVVAVFETGGTYAVRSSAVGEDGVSSSFAGQFDSVLDCDTPAKVAAAVCRVWASLLNPRALAYADQTGGALSQMAVIIQKQVAAVASGVLFTVDPRPSGAGQMVVEFCDGLGERLVSGHVTPASGVIDRQSGAFSVERQAETPASWTPSQGAVALRDLGLALEAEFGCPQDIEFSVDPEGRIILLQSRPITTVAAHVPMVSWSNANIAENFPDPVCDMLQSFVARGYGAYFRSLAVAFGVPRARVDGLGDKFDEVVACHGGRLYYNLSNIHALLYAVPGGRRLAQYFNTFTGAQGLAPLDGAGRTALREAFELVQMPFRIAIHYSLLPRRLRAFEDRIDAFAATSDRQALDGKSAAELALLVEGFLDIRLTTWTPAALSDAAAMISYGLLGSILRDHPAIDENELLQGLPGLASAAPVEALWELSEKLRQDPAADIIRDQSPDDALAQLQRGDLGDAGQLIWDYLDTWGFRSSGELLLIRPTPQEDPISVLRLLRAYLQSVDAGPVEKSLGQAQVRIDRTRAAMRSLGLFQRQVFRVVLWATQKSIGMRERARMKQALLYSRLRQVALAAGRTLTAAGVLDQPADIFHLTLEEMTGALRGQTLAEGTVANRKQEMADHETWSPPAAFMLPQGQRFQSGDVSVVTADHGNDAHCLRGTPACAGRTTGTAAVVLDVSEIDTIQKDQILVTRQTDPGWAAVFFLVKGLVIERGGLLSHGAIIAREYGIPAVIGVEGATTLIETGAKIEVLADIGEVRIHAE